MPPFDSIEFSDHVPARGAQRGFTLEQARACITNPDHIDKSDARRGTRGGLIWKFRKSFRTGTLKIVAEVYKNRCYPITGYWET